MLKVYAIVFLDGSSVTDNTNDVSGSTSYFQQALHVIMTGSLLFVLQYMPHQISACGELTPG